MADTAAIEAEKKFERNVRILANIIEYPQEGLTAWHETRINMAKEIFQFLWDKGFRPKED